MKANFPNSLQHMQKEPVSKETGIFCMSSMRSETGKGCEGRACLPTRLLPPARPPGRAGSIPSAHHRTPARRGGLVQPRAPAASSRLPCSIGALVVIRRGRRWAVFISAAPVNLRDHSSPQESNMDNHKVVNNPGRARLLILRLAEPEEIAPNQELTPKAYRLSSQEWEAGAFSRPRTERQEDTTLATLPRRG